MPHDTSFLIWRLQAGVLVVIIFCLSQLFAAPPEPTADLATVVAQVAAQVDRQGDRFDFMFKHDDWELSMSAVLSVDGKSLWLMSWLDELPREAALVPRNALLRLLATNDAMGNGKFFAYIPNNRRFVLQRSVPNEGIDEKKLASLLKDLAETVVETEPVWCVEKW